LNARRPPSLLARALALQARREHSRAELAQRLAPHAQSAEEVERALDTLAAKGLLSESRFAEALVHRRAERFGAARIRHELKDKGIGGDLLSAATAAIAASELDRARAVWRKKFGAPPTNPPSAPGRCASSPVAVLRPRWCAGWSAATTSRGMSPRRRPGPNIGQRKLGPGLRRGDGNRCCQ
jgi:regulatory protein